MNPCVTQVRAHKNIHTDIRGEVVHGGSSFLHKPDVEIWDDAELVAEAQRGDSSAFVRLCDQYSGRVFKTICRITRNREDAEDALQDALMKAYCSLGSFEGRSSFYSWLTRIAINSSLMILRRKRVHHETSYDGGMEAGEGSMIWEIVDHAEGPEKLYLLAERKQMLQKAIGRLQPALRSVIQIQRIEERSVEETAEILQISVAATKSRLLRARATLSRSSHLRKMRPLRTAQPA